MGLGRASTQCRRPWGTAWFLIEFLKGNRPAGSAAIDPAAGAALPDIYLEYKTALHRTWASPDPAQLPVVSLSSFAKYCGHLMRLGWIERANTAAPPRILYRLTKKGWEATASEIADPIRTLYHYSRNERSPKRHRYYRDSHAGR